MKKYVSRIGLLFFSGGKSKTELFGETLLKSSTFLCLRSKIARYHWNNIILENFSAAFFLIFFSSLFLLSCLCLGAFYLITVLLIPWINEWATTYKVKQQVKRWGAGENRWCGQTTCRGEPHCLTCESWRQLSKGHVVKLLGTEVRHKGRWHVELCRKIKSVLPFSWHILQLQGVICCLQIIYAKCFTLRLGFDARCHVLPIRTKETWVWSRP